MWSSSVTDRTRGTRPFMLIIISESDEGLDGGMTFFVLDIKQQHTVAL